MNGKTAKRLKKEMIRGMHAIRDPQKKALALMNQDTTWRELKRQYNAGKILLVPDKAKLYIEVPRPPEELTDTSIKTK